MPDFRTRFYDRYVSTFKRDDGTTERDLRSSQQYWDYKYLPLIKQIDPAAEILDIGCGPGHFLQFLSQVGYPNAQGIDVSAEQVELAERRGVKAFVADAFEHLSQHESTYGLIVAIDVIEHFTKEELIKLLYKIHAALKPNGLFLIQTPNGGGLFANGIIYGDMTHSSILSVNSLQQLLRLVGFGRLQFFETGPAPKNLAGIVRFSLWKLIRIAANAVRMVETGRSQQIWTQNVICCARKTQDEHPARKPHVKLTY
jgi:2-polyprenyl-3-methyl-5-hydroxy-6-metoxy-1,4-benzoquinol methylase